MSVSERAVAEYMTDHPDEVAGCSARELCECVDTRDIPVVRTTEALGYAGFSAPKRTLPRKLTRQRELAAMKY